MTLFFVNREPITEYGRVFVERQNNLSEERNTNWHRTLVLGRTDIDGNPNHQLNGGIRGLSKHRCLGSMANHGAGSRKNAEYKTYDYTSLQAILDPVCKSDASVGKSMLLLASRDIQKDEQILCNYEPNSARGMDIPFDNVSLGTFMRICGRSLQRALF